MEKKIVMVHIRLEEPIADALKRLAKADDRKLATYVARVLKKHVVAEGEYAEPAETKPKGGRKS
jgi:hypothetical protein